MNKIAHVSRFVIIAKLISPKSWTKFRIWLPIFFEAQIKNWNRKLSAKFIFTPILKLSSETIEKL